MEKDITSHIEPFSDELAALLVENSDEVIEILEDRVEEAAPLIGNIALVGSGEIKEWQKTPLDLVLAEDSFKIKNSSKNYSLITNTRVEFPYDDIKRKALMAMVATQGKIVAPRHLWEIMYPGQPVDSRGLKIMNRFLASVTYGKQRVFEDTGKRGRGAYYWVSPNFNLNLIDEFDKGNEVVNFKVEKVDWYLAASHLKGFDFALRHLGLPKIEDDVFEDIAEYKPNLADYGGAQEIKKQRAKSLKAVTSVLEADRAILRRMFDDRTSFDPEFGLIKYLKSLDDRQRPYITKFLKGRTDTITFGAGEYRLEALDHNDNPIVSIDAFTAKREAEVQAAEADSTIYDRRTEISEATPKNINREQTVELLKELAKDAAYSFLEKFRADGAYRREHLMAAFPNLTTDKVASAKTNNIIPRTKHRPLNIHDVVRLALYSDPFTQQFFTVRKYKKDIDAAVKSAIEEAVEATERQLTGLED